MGLCALPLLAGCDLLFPVEPVLTPPKRPATPVRTTPAEPAIPSASSAALRAYYRTVLQDGLTRGLLRTDGGGPDTPYNARLLARNFEAITFFNEYPGSGQTASAPLRRWQGPVRIEARFGASVSPADRTRDANALRSYSTRLARITGHPISYGGAANFHVFFAGEDDRTQILADIRRLQPNIDRATLARIRNLPRSTYCLVVAFTNPAATGTYSRAIALIRAEQPDLMRLSCIHEEVAQGLGLANDSPAARPSIFNDDDEFALLTSHDEQLLKMLYDPRLRPGLSAELARPIVNTIARELMGSDLTQ